MTIDEAIEAHKKYEKLANERKKVLEIKKL